MAHDRQARQKALVDTTDAFSDYHPLCYNEQRELRRIIVANFKPIFDEMDKDKEETWRTVEDVCTGTPLFCEKCQRNHPCDCDHGPES